MLLKRLIHRFDFFIGRNVFGKHRPTLKFEHEGHEVNLKVGLAEPRVRERRIKDANGRILRSEFPVYAKIEGRYRTARLCTFDTLAEAVDYMRALTS